MSIYSKILRSSVAEQGFWSELTKLGYGHVSGWSQHDEWVWNEDKVRELPEEIAKHFYERWCLGLIKAQPVYNYLSCLSYKRYPNANVYIMDDGKKAYDYLGVLVRIPDNIETLAEMSHYSWEAFVDKGTKQGVFVYTTDINDVAHSALYFSMMERYSKYHRVLKKHLLRAIMLRVPKDMKLQMFFVKEGWGVAVDNSVASRWNWYESNLKKLQTSELEWILLNTKPWINIKSNVIKRHELLARYYLLDVKIHEVYQKSKLTDDEAELIKIYHELKSLKVEQVSVKHEFDNM